MVRWPKGALEFPPAGPQTPPLVKHYSIFKEQKKYNKIAQADPLRVRLIPRQWDQGRTTQEIKVTHPTSS
jgi:hypothetical protein